MRLDPEEGGALSQDTELKTLERTLGDVADTLLDDLRKLGENNGSHQVKEKCQNVHGSCGEKDKKAQRRGHVKISIFKISYSCLENLPVDCVL